MTATAFKSFTFPDLLIDKFNPSSVSSAEALSFSKFTFSAISEAKAVPEGKDAIEYEKAFIKLEAAIKAFSEAVYVAQYSNYYEDFEIAENVNFEKDKASAELTDEGLLLLLP